jgi:hypothetical protein
VKKGNEVEQFGARGRSDGPTDQSMADPSVHDLLSVFLTDCHGPPQATQVSSSTAPLRKRDDVTEMDGSRSEKRWQPHDWIHEIRRRWGRYPR